MKHIEALKMALKDLLLVWKDRPSITAIREALVEQPSKPLTDAQIGAVAADTWGSVLIAPQSYQAFARAIEAAHGITGEPR